MPWLAEGQGMWGTVAVENQVFAAPPIPVLISSHAPIAVYMRLAWAQTHTHTHTL